MDSGSLLCRKAGLQVNAPSKFLTGMWLLYQVSKSTLKSTSDLMRGKKLLLWSLENVESCLDLEAAFYFSKLGALTCCGKLCLSHMTASI